MRIISNRRGNYVQVLEEFKVPKRSTLVNNGYTIKWLVVLYNGQVCVFYGPSTRIWSKDEFIDYVEMEKNTVWRNNELKKDSMYLYENILNSVVKFERELKIDEVLRDENEYKYWVC